MEDVVGAVRVDETANLPQGAKVLQPGGATHRHRHEANARAGGTAGAEQCVLADRGVEDVDRVAACPQSVEQVEDVARHPGCCRLDEEEDAQGPLHAAAFRAARRASIAPATSRPAST